MSTYHKCPLGDLGVSTAEVNTTEKSARMNTQATKAKSDVAMLTVQRGDMVNVMSMSNPIKATTMITGITVH